MSLDADEELSSALSRKLSEFVKTEHHPAPSLFRIKRQLVFMGQKMRFGRTIDYPTRLFRRGAAEFCGSIHESLKAISGASDQVGYVCDGEILHYSYADLQDYFAKFNRYTSLMADSRAKQGRDVSTLSLCLRPFFIFIYRYLLKLGFLDGYPGFCWAFFGSVYSFVKYAKLKEIAAGKSKYAAHP